jgi:hypothetical protein
VICCVKKCNANAKNAKCAKGRQGGEGRECASRSIARLILSNSRIFLAFLASLAVSFLLSERGFSVVGDCAACLSCASRR